MERNTKTQEAYLKEWEVIMSKYPRFARAHLAQQAVLMEAALSGDLRVVQRMCELQKGEVVQLFNGFWRKKCDKLTPMHLLGTGNEAVDCLIETQGDAARCFKLKKDLWFDDPTDYAFPRFPPKPPPKPYEMPPTQPPPPPPPPSLK